MIKPSSNRFAAFDGDRLVALVADGLPEWPAFAADATDEQRAEQLAAFLTELSDVQLAEMETAGLEQFETLAALPAEDEGATPEALQAASDRVWHLRIEAGTRYAAAVLAGDTGAGDGGGTDGAADAGAGAGDGAPADPNLADAGAGDGSGDEPSRDDLVAQLRAGMSAPPAAAPDAPEPGVSREDLVAAVTAGAQASAEFALGQMQTQLAATARTIITAVREPAPAGIDPRRQRAGDASGFQHGRLAPLADGSAPADVPNRGPLNARLITTADVPSIPLGTEITSRSMLVDAFASRMEGIGTATGVSDEKITIATMKVDPPAEYDLRGMSSFGAFHEARKKIQQVLADQPYDKAHTERVLTASGGLAAPVAPYYEQLVIAQNDRPVQAANPTFVMDRGGIKLVLPPSIGSVTGVAVPGQFADGVTNTDTSLVSAAAAFAATDVGSFVTGAGIPNGTQILTRTNATTVVLTAATTATATGVTFQIRSRNPNNLGGPVGLVTAAQDAAGSPTTIKLTYDVPNGSQTEFDVYSVYTSLQFGNLTARTFPEQVEAYIRVADALHARAADTQMLDVMTAWSTLLTGAKTFGTARQLLAQWEHMAADYRNTERMRAGDPLVIGVPAWCINAMRGDWVSTFLGGDSWGLSDDELISFFAERNLTPWLYLDGPSDVSQLFATSGLAAATNTGTNSATPIAIPDYPGQGATTSFRTKIVSFMYAPGTFVNGTTGELNLGLVRDSLTNSQNKFRNFMEEWETPAFVGTRAFRCVHTVASDGTYGAAASITLGAGAGI